MMKSPPAMTLNPSIQIEKKSIAISPRLFDVWPGYASVSWMPISHHTCAFVTFPGIISHGVTLHCGTTPRISIAWNINATKLPGEVTHDGTMTR